MYHPLHARFVMLLPRIEAHAKIYFRDVRCAAKRADCIAEVIALAWSWFIRLETRGKDVSTFASSIATYAARAVRCGRRVASIEKAKDLMNSQAQQRHGLAVDRLPDLGTSRGNLLAAALADNTVTPPPDASVSFSCQQRFQGVTKTRLRARAAIHGSATVFLPQIPSGHGEGNLWRKNCCEEVSRFEIAKVASF